MRLTSRWGIFEVTFTPPPMNWISEIQTIPEESTHCFGGDQLPVYWASWRDRGYRDRPSYRGGYRGSQARIQLKTHRLLCGVFAAIFAMRYSEFSSHVSEDEVAVVAEALSFVVVFTCRGAGESPSKLPYRSC